MVARLPGPRSLIGPVACVLVLAGVAIALTYPFVLHPGSTVTAPLGYDISSSIGRYAAIVREGVTPFTWGRLETIGVPEGVPLTPGFDLVSFLSSSVLWIGSLTIGSIAVHGLMSLLGLALTAIVTFFFVRAITGCTPAGLVAACAYGFFPHAVLMARAAQVYTHMWLFILPLWACTELVQRPGRRQAIIAGLSGLPAIFWTPYYTLHVLVEMLALGIVVLALLARRAGVRRTLALVGVAALPVIAGMVAYTAIGVGTGFEDVPTRASEDHYSQSAHPLMYLMPGSDIWAWGPGATDLLVDQVPRSVGNNLYLGLSVLALAICGLGWLAVEGRRALRRPSPARDPDVGASRAWTAGVLAASTALLTAVWSLPPTIDVFGLTVSTPSRITLELVPALRAGLRFVMVVMAGVAVLAGIGAWRLLRRAPRPAVPVLGVLLAAIVLVDLSVNPPGRTTRVPQSTALAALRAEPSAPTVHYQSTDPGELLVGPVSRPCVFQIQHEKPLVNFCNLRSPPPPKYALLLEVGDPTSCLVADKLKRQLGVRYVIVDAAIEPFPACVGRRGGPRVLAVDGDFTVLKL